jgi:excisionase family DNA binding protein
LTSPRNTPIFSTAHGFTGERPAADALVEVNMEKLLTATEAAELLGLTRSALYMAIQRREMPVLRLGQRRIRFRASDLEKILQAQAPVERERKAG